MIPGRPLFPEVERRRERHREVAVRLAVEPRECAVCRDPIHVGENFATIDRGPAVHLRCMRGAR